MLTGRGVSVAERSEHTAFYRSGPTICYSSVAPVGKYFYAGLHTIASETNNATKTPSIVHDAINRLRIDIINATVEPSANATQAAPNSQLDRAAIDRPAFSETNRGGVSTAFCPNPTP